MAGRARMRRSRRSRRRPSRRCRRSTACASPPPRPGVRYQGRLDVMLAEVAAGAAIAGVFTRSATRSGPVLWCEEKLAALRHGARGQGGFAILVNSGNANAFTGSGRPRGGRGDRRRRGRGARACRSGHVFVASTGVIGEPLPAERIVAALGAPARRPGGGRRRAGGAGDHDHRHLPQGRGGADRARRRAGDDHRLRQGLGDDRAGHGDDAGLPLHRRRGRRGPLLQAMVARAHDATFNCITVDGDTSTSDTLLMAATGRAAMPPIAEAGDPRLARLRGGAGRGDARPRPPGGARRRGGDQVRRGPGRPAPRAAADARKVGLAIANSPLVKTAIAGEDPNWGRIVMAVGKSGAAADRDRLCDPLRRHPGRRAGLGRALLPRGGRGGLHEAGRSSSSASTSASASGAATIWTCDLTHRYIEINADYRS